MCAFRDMLVGALISVYRLSDICMCLNLTSIRTSFFRPSICSWFSLRSCSIWARRSSISERAPCRDCLVTSCSAFSLLISPVRFSSCKHVNKICVCTRAHSTGDCRLPAGLKCMAKYYLTLHKIVLPLTANSI